MITTTKIGGVLIGLITFAIVGKITQTGVFIVGVLVFGDGEEAVRNMDAAANIVGFIAGAYCFSAVYRRIVSGPASNAIKAQ
jgi:hypothetical protein